MELPLPEIQPRVIFLRYGTPQSWDQWDLDGTIILPEIFTHLKATDICEFIKDEFNMYRHHYRPVPGRPQLGFLRNMFHALIQQVVRQDPVWYALMVACRPDHNIRLISYPYTAKDSLDGDATGFFHVDINLKRFIEEAIGTSQLTSSISLDNENATSCTIVVPGFDKHLPEWYERLKRRGDVKNGTTTNAKNIYRRQDKKDFGEPISVPCAANGLRITLPSVLHGATSTVNIRRRVIYAWFTGIQEDHETLEIPGQLTWSEVAACHRDLEAPLRGVGGDIPSHSVPPFRFPASIHIPSSYPLGDALLGRRKYDDPEVILDIQRLLGPDDAVAADFVTKARQSLLANYRIAFQKLVELETQLYPDTSYFKYHKRTNMDMEITNSDG